MKKTAILYCDPKSLNDATVYYVDIIKRALIEEGYEWDVVHNLSQIQNANLIVTITAQFFLWAKIRHPFTKTIFWAQGVSAEEAKIRINSCKTLLRFIFRRFAESMAVKSSSLLFCVSNRMLEYYRKNYGSIDCHKVIIMPCYNLHLDANLCEERYQVPSFVYAGGASSWQCIDTMLDVYSYIEKKLPNSHLTILSNEDKIFIDKIQKRDIHNFQIKYVKVEQLQIELQKYKYGFVLRDKHIINEVATPTKMNSYLASLLIPIFSDGVDDFERHIKLGEFTLMGKCPLNIAAIGDSIIEFENTNHCYSDFARYVDEIFNDYYNDSKYCKEIVNKVRLIN